MVNVHTLAAVGVNAEGYREILGIEVTSAEDGAGWLAFFRAFVARGLSGVRLVTSDAHAGPRVSDRRHPARSARGNVPDPEEIHGPGCVRSCTLFTTNRTPIRLMLNMIGRSTPCRRSFRGSPTTSAHNLLAFTRFRSRSGVRSGPTIHYRLNKEIRRRTDVVGIFPDRTALIRLVGVVLAEQHDEWIEARRYLGLDVLAWSRGTQTTPEPAEEVAPAALTA
nr:hypothetical protein GCM10017611_79740 [Rhodococcus wratislaviensis]